MREAKTRINGIFGIKCAFAVVDFGDLGGLMHSKVAVIAAVVHYAS